MSKVMTLRDAAQPTHAKGASVAILNTSTRRGRSPSLRDLERARQAQKARETMRVLGFSQRQVAGALDDHQTTVARMLAGKTEMGRTELVVMARRGGKRLALALAEALLEEVRAA